MSLLTVLIQAVFTASLAWLLWKFCSHYFVRSCIDHIPGPQQNSLLLGGVSGTTSLNGWKFLDDLADGYGSVVRLRDVLGNKMLYVMDPLALHTILVRGSHLYEEPPEFLIGVQLLLGPGLVSSVGDTHKKQRKMISPLFSTQNLRNVTPVLAHVANDLKSAIAVQVQHSAEDIDMVQWSSRTMLEMTGRGLFDLSLDLLVEGKANEYAAAIKETFPAVFSVPFHFFFAITWAKTFGITKFGRWVANKYPNAKVRRVKNIVDTLWRQAETMVEQKKVASTGRGERGKDMLSLLVRANELASEEDRLTDEEIVAQVNTLIFGSVETATTTACRILNLLSEHPEAQERLRSEIQEACRDFDELPYDKLIELPFLDAVYRETARLYPPVLQSNRVTQEDTILPLLHPIPDVDGHMIHEVPLHKGTTVMIGIHGYNRCKSIWGEDATEWKPERWLAPLPETVRNVPSGGTFANLMTFIGGSRSCIGLKYAELEIKTMLCYLLESFKFSPGKEEIVWNTSRVCFPTTGMSKGDSEAAMPLKVELIKPLSA